MAKKQFANIDFNLEWKSSAATHQDCSKAVYVDLKEDIFPGGLVKLISNLSIGESCEIKLHAKELLGEDYSTERVISFPADLFETQFKNQFSPPNLYRFYPSAIAWQGLKTHEKDYTPFRLISKSDENLVADRNHPLAKYYVTITATKIEEFNKPLCNRTAINIGKFIAAKGPGMQAPFEFGDPVFFDEYPYKVINNSKALKQSSSNNSREEIESVFLGLLPKFSKILELQCDDLSHLSSNYQTGLLVGIGHNEELLSKNERLDTYSVQDLNKDMVLPYEENSFDDAICSLSIDSLIDALAIMKEVARVVNKGGMFCIIFSDDYQSDQSIDLWKQLHPFEKMQLVLEYFRKTGLFSNLNTLSKRNFSQSTNDKKASSNIYAVWGSVF